MVEDTLLLLRNYWAMDRRQESSPRARVAGLLVRSVGLITAVALSGLLGYGVGFFITDPDIPLEVRLGTVPGLLLTLVLLATLIVGINQALRALYLTNDMELLFSAPLRSESILSAKLLSRLPLTIIIALVLTIPALIAFGVVTGLGPGFYVAGTLALLLAPLFGLAAGALTAMLIVRVLPAQRVAEYVGAVSILFGVLISILFQLPRFLRSEDGISSQDVAALNATIDGLENLPLPSMWAGQGLVDLAQGRIVDGLLNMSAYFLLTAGFFAAVLLIANRLYLNSWLRMQGSGYTRGGYTSRAGLFGGRSVETGIAAKDWLLRLRDARQLASLASGLIFGAFFAFLILRGGGGEPGNPWEAQLSTFVGSGVTLAGALLYVGWATFSQTATAVLSLEGPSLYLLQAAPIDPRTVYRSKLLSLFTPYALLTAVIMLLGWFLLDFNGAWGVYAWLCLLLIGYGMLGISTALGFAYPRLDWDDPRRMSSPQAGWRNLLFTIPYGLLSLVLAAAPFVISRLWPAWTLPAVLLGLLLLGAISWLTSLWGAKTAVRSWARA